MNSKNIAEQIFHAGVKSVLPDKILKGNMKIEENKLIILNTSNKSDIVFSLSELKNIYVIGAGKASALMAKEVESILGNRITDGHIVVKHGHACPLKYIQLTEAGHPTPDIYGINATSEILKLAKKANENDLVLCLFSGGGSSLLADFPDESNLEDLIEMNQLLLKCGADIHEINTVRKHTSKVKGGQLAKAASPSSLVSLILSDVIGDSLDVIASGPTSPDSSYFKNVRNIIEKYELTKRLPSSISGYLNKGFSDLIPETPKEGDVFFDKTHNLIIGSNRIALQAAQKKAEEFGFETIIVTSELDGDACKAAENIVKITVEKQNKKSKDQKICLLFGGEPTVLVSGNGLGGRNQHLALCVAQLIAGKEGITLLSAGTDGNDGPTDAAGAVVDGKTIQLASLSDIDSNKYFKEFDSYHFFKQTEGHIITGSTLTNVMDLIVVLID